MVSLVLRRILPARLWPSDFGTAFHLEFPSYGEGADVKIVQVIVTIFETSAPRRRILISLADEPLTRPRPLVVVADADAQVARCLCKVLEHNGFWAVIAATGSDVLMHSIKSQPDLVLLDVDLAGGGGLAVCTKLRSDPRTRTIPVVICSAWGEDAHEAAKAGAAAYLDKPAGFVGLAQLLRHILKNALPLRSEPGQW